VSDARREEGRRPRVLLVGQGPPTTGGIPTFVTRLSQDPWLAERVALEYLNTTPRAVKRPGAFSGGNLRQALGDAARISRRARGKDLVHLNLAATPLLPLVRALLLALAGRAVGARVILHAHTGQLESSLRSRPYRVVFRMVGRVAHAIVVVSEPAEAAAVPLVRRVMRIENGIPLERFRTGPKDPDPPLVSFAGTVCERKGLLDLRDALVRLRDGEGRLPVRVAIAGDGAQEGPGAFERVRNAYREAGLGGVEFLGAVGPDDVADLLARSAIFCLPSHYEGFPLAVLEAMASEAAVVATGVGDVPRILDGGRAGVLVPVGDGRRLSEALGSLARSPEERGALAAAGRARVASRWDEDRMVRRLLELYRRVAGDGA